MLGSRPTLEQVREHAERHPHQHEFGGLWRYHDGYLQRFCLLSVKHGDVYTNVLSGPRVLLDTWLCTHVANNWTPCDQAGNPLPLAFDERTEWAPCTPDGDPLHLAEERNYYRDQYEKMQASVAVVRQELDELKQQVCDLASQLAALRQKMGNVM